MPSGYQTRISPAYWSSPDVSWTGTKWTAGSVSQCRMVPSSGMILDAPSEIRMLITVSGVKLIWQYDGSAFRTQYMVSGLSNERVVIRSPYGLSTSLRLDFDIMTPVDILEIEVGLIGNH